MTPIQARFQSLHQQGRTALIPFITAGDPDLGTTRAALQALDQEGADLIELGIPYADPLADGPVIQAASTRALRAGTQLPGILQMLAGMRLQAPVIIFSYYNPIYQLGIPKFMGEVRWAGGSGVVIPDVPLEESPELREQAQGQGLDWIALVAPTSSPARMQAIAAQSSGFIYLVSTTGVTGQRQVLGSRIPGLLGQLRQYTDLPIGVGFGISNPEQARQVADWGADGVIVGSACVQHLAEGGV
ncbi:MAG: tryptophan synthase subunit alpha, partial [Thermostichales cyanobacterium SRBZ-1_bins_19]